MTKTSVELDSDDPFDAVLIEMLNINRKKRADYAGNDHAFQNFVDSAYQLGGTPGESCEVLIATKQSRLRHLISGDVQPQNEAVRDTLLDRSVYSGIALAIYDLGWYDPERVVVAGITEV